MEHTFKLYIHYANDKKIEISNRVVSKDRLIFTDDNKSDAYNGIVDIILDYIKYLPDDISIADITHDGDSFHIYSINEIDVENGFINLSKLANIFIRYFEFAADTYFHQNKAPVIYVLGIASDGKDVFVYKLPNLPVVDIGDRVAIEVLQEKQMSLATKYHTIGGIAIYDAEEYLSSSNKNYISERDLAYYLTRMISSKILPPDHPFSLSCQEAFDSTMREINEYLSTIERIKEVKHNV